MLPKWVKVTKNRFDEIQSIATETKNNKLKTTIGGKTINSVEELIKDTASRKTECKKALDRYNAILDSGVNKIINLKYIHTKNQNRILDIFSMLRETFTGSDVYDKKQIKKQMQKQTKKSR